MNENCSCMNRHGSTGKKELERKKGLVKASLGGRKRGIHTSKTLAHSSHIQQQVRLSTACNGTSDSTGRVGEGRATRSAILTWDRVRLLDPPDATCRSKPPSTLVPLIHALLFAPIAPGVASVVGRVVVEPADSRGGRGAVRAILGQRGESGNRGASLHFLLS
ncbi:hypothetical protein C8J57DRAFT_1357872 [Mycena rebaudengoi]|nr:hypothetical protein C8J57DRAFT_1357872 [Mycena rebaudengoi]